MDLRPNSRAAALTESVTLAISAQAQKLRAEGIDVISLSAGEPDFGTPAEVGAAGIAAIQAGETRYTAAAGTPALRAAGATWLNQAFGLDYSPAEVMATAGAKPALHMALMCLLEPGQKVLLPAPYWVSYPSLVEIAGGVPVDLAPVPAQDFVHSPEQIRAAAAEHGAVGVMLNYPNNPSGAVPSPAQMREIAAACVEAGCWIISDEIYATMLYDSAVFESPARSAREHCLVVNGGSKSHSLTGWRIGFLAGPKQIIQAAAKMQSQAIGNPSAVSQAAGKAACELDLGAELARRNAAFDGRRKMLVEGINGIEGCSARLPQGAFYVFADVRGLCARLGVDDLELCKRLLDEARIALVPGTAFAAPGFVRLSYAASEQDLEQALARLRAFVAELP